MRKVRGDGVSDRYDIAIVGSGFSGSLLAMIARRLGHSVVLIEKGKHPRVVIGESSTPLTNVLLEELATRYDLPNVKSLAKWGTWQKEHPEVACGLKRGFTFFHHDLDRPRTTYPDRCDQLLVTASPNDEYADTHWYRSDFDHLLVRESQKLGVVYLDETKLGGVVESDNGVELKGTREGKDVTLSAKLVVDASGPRGFLYRALGLAERELQAFPKTQALYSHFSGVERLENLEPAIGPQPPYPVDDAAVHHVFEGGWIWVLQFNNGITSAGIAANSLLAERLKLSGGVDAWHRVLRSIPLLQEQFVHARAEQPFTRMQQVSFRSAAIAGANWALLPSAAGFVDPLLSTGFPLALLGVSRLVNIIELDWNSSRFSSRLQTYAEKTDAELVATGRLIGSLYANMDNFQVFVALSLLYFAAASFSETARRLQKPHLAPSFLLHDDPSFGPDCLRLFARAQCKQTQQESSDLIRDILSAIEPFNVAGLGNSECHNWYPIDPSDLLHSAWKVQSSHAEVHQVLSRCGFRL